MNSFSDPEYEGQTFKNLSLPAARLAGVRFDGCTFVRCTLREAELRACRLLDCTFRECDLSLAALPGAALREVSFEACSLVGVDWAAADWPLHVRAAPLRFTGCTLDYGSFARLALEGLEMRNCHAHEVDFSGAALSGADFAGTTLAGSHFSGADLSRADLRQARDYLFDVRQCKVAGARFALPAALALLYALDIALEEWRSAAGALPRVGCGEGACIPHAASVRPA